METTITEAIVLVGGFGTRLKSVVENLPKPMAEVAGRPFLTYILDRLIKGGINRVILSTGFLHHVIYQYFGKHYKSLDILYSQEEEPLFTGGAIRLALQKTNAQTLFVVNGDTYFDTDFSDFQHSHFHHKGLLSVALREVENTERYGKVITDNNNRIISFTEKGNIGCGYVNSGLYVVTQTLFQQLELGSKFSFEKDVMEKFFDRFSFYGFPAMGYFIDIGIPEDYFKAQKQFSIFNE